MATAQADTPAPERAARAAVGIVFLTIFLDLVGFSVILPLFPAMLKYYFHEAQAGGLLAGFLATAHHLAPGAGEVQVAVLFGGLLGSLYSVLQFFFSPFWGHLSDRWGRRKVLLVTVAGTSFSYLLWIFAGQFWILVLARLLGGMMAGNLSVCTAAIADVTPVEKRSRGMAVVGVAFGLGFILGPALGGISSLFNLLDKYPGGATFGLNPFSVCALISFGLSVINYFWVIARFPETLAPEQRAAAATKDRQVPGLGRLAGIFKVDKPEIRRANLVNLFYWLAFSGMEFTLTFLATERFAFTPRDMVNMFVFMGFMMVVVRGWLGRKYVSRWGERRTAMWSFAGGMIGFLLLGFAPTVPWFYAGMGVFSLSVGLTSVCLPALVSMYSDSSTQGRHLGAFNSAAALARAIGPIASSLIYFSAGAKASYTFGAVALIVPLALAVGLPEPRREKPAVA
jgi:MFS family permease